ncbi:MAG: hypothetical protein JW870_01850 [Candidatus Delongbacteria bacterium]|nr:hypothetical protein [Candidatus Delongbacteria bacterium]
MSAITFDASLRAPFTMVIAGPTQAGKSQLTKQIIQRNAEIIFPRIEKIVYCYGVKQEKLHNELSSTCSNITFNYGLPEEYGNDLLQHYLYVLDDLMFEASKSKDVLNAFVRGSHHKNCSIIFITQNFFYDGLRNLTTNAKYICLFKNPSETQVIKKVGMRMNCGRKWSLMEDAYKYCISSSHGYLFIDCSQQQDDRFRLRNSIFPENCTVFVNKIE